MNIYDSCLIIERMKKVVGIVEDQDLGKLFEKPKSTVSNWKTRNSLPIVFVFDFFNKYDVDLHWLLTGEERKPALDEMEQMLLNNYKRLDPAQKLQLLNASLNGVGSGINQVANGDNNKQKLITGNVGEVTGIRK